MIFALILMLSEMRTHEVGAMCNRFVYPQIRCTAIGTFPDRVKWYVYRGDYRPDQTQALRGDVVYPEIWGSWTDIRMITKNTEVCLQGRWGVNSKLYFRRAACNSTDTNTITTD